ncbi:MAG: hypothetical protein H0T48_14495 [Gemmatimonadaceae bacterium]|nr:hypothetical protein [Gemmatimonadaceae bacterium]
MTRGRSSSPGFIARIATCSRIGPIEAIDGTTVIESSRFSSTAPMHNARSERRYPLAHCMQQRADDAAPLTSYEKFL